MSTVRTITLSEEDDGWWVATDEEIDVTSQGSTRSEALENLDEAVALYNGEIGHEPTADELRALGIDPEENQDSGELPPVLGGPEPGRDE